MRKLMWVLLSNVPSMISVKYTPDRVKDDISLSATVEDILARMQQSPQQ